MLIERIKQYSIRALSAIAGLGLFIVMLPLTLGMMLIMGLAGIATVLAVRHRLRKSGAGVNWNNDKETFDQQTGDILQRPPIEGSYKVIRK